LAVGPDGHLYFGSDHVYPILASDDNGAMWREASRDLVGPSQVAVAPSNPAVVYVFGKHYDRNPPPGLPIWRSADGGRSWEQRLRIGPYGSHVVDPADENTIYSVGQGVVLRSRGGAASYEQYAIYDADEIPTGVLGSRDGAGIAAINADGSRLWFVTFSGRMYLSRERGQVWERLPDVPSSYPIRSLSSAPWDPGVFFAVARDDSARRSELWVYREPDSTP
jgi:hypothetical protein